MGVVTTGMLPFTIIIPLLQVGCSIYPNDVILIKDAGCIPVVD